MTALVDPTGRLVIELRSDAGVSAITQRIRVAEPDSGDALGAGKYVPFVVLVRLGYRRLARAPIQSVTYVARCYGVTHQGATQLAMAVSAAVHGRGHRISSGVAIFGSLDTGGSGSGKDPDTGQPHEDVVIQLGASTEVIS